MKEAIFRVRCSIIHPLTDTPILRAMGPAT